MKYRTHRGDLEDSMRTTVTVNSKEELLAHINKDDIDSKATDISFEYCVYDARIGWDTWYVMAKYKEYPYPIIVGMSDSNTFKEVEHG